MSNDSFSHYRAIRRELGVTEELVWYGQPCPDRRRGVETILPTALVAFVFTAWATAGFARTAAQNTTIYLAMFGLALLASCVIIPWLRGPTLYALTDRRALRASGRAPIAVVWVWLSDLTSITWSGRDGFGTIRCASRQPTWALGRRNADHQPIFRRIINPQGVHAMILRLRPDLAAPGGDSGG